MIISLLSVIISIFVKGSWDNDDISWFIVIDSHSIYMVIYGLFPYSYMMYDRSIIVLVHDISRGFTLWQSHMVCCKLTYI